MFGLKGSGDILGILPDGRFFSCEIKYGRDTIKPEQQGFADRVNSMGGVALIVRSLEDFEAQMDEVLK